MQNFGMECDPPFVAVIGDILGSRQLRDRAGVQRRLRSALEQINAWVATEGLAAAFRLTAGDEFQGLLTRPELIVDITRRLADALPELRIIFGVGRGELTTELYPDVGSLDGPCFHLAREALDTAREDDVWLRARGFGPPFDATTSALFRLLDIVRRDWTEKQARYAREARTRLQKDVAAMFDVSPSVVSESLKAASFQAVLEAEEAARSLLKASHQFGLITEI